MWYRVTAWCDEGPFRLETDNYDEALDWAAFNEKKFGVKPSVVEEMDDGVSQENEFSRI